MKRGALRFSLALAALVMSGVTAADARRARPPERSRLIGFAVSPTHPRVNQVIRFTFVVRNAGEGSLFPANPPPRTLYTQGESYRQKRHRSAPGSYRVAVGWQGDGAGHPFRWGLGRSVYAGQTISISGRAQMRRPGIYRLHAQMERVGFGRVGLERTLRLEVRPRAAARILVNDQPLSPPASPVLRRGSVLVPLRAVATALGASVTWHAGRRTVVIQGPEGTLSLRPGSRVLRADGRSIRMRVAPRLLAGRVMVPLRPIAEALGAGVAWEPRTREVRLSTGSR